MSSFPAFISFLLTISIASVKQNSSILYRSRSRSMPVGGIEENCGMSLCFRTVFADHFLDDSGKGDLDQNYL
ncbi:hypothetical protein KAJ27_10715, partial [bacterium]|nr:hypothetical protein [bacterium]